MKSYQQTSHDTIVSWLVFVMAKDINMPKAVYFVKKSGDKFPLAESIKYFSKKFDSKTEGIVTAIFGMRFAVCDQRRHMFYYGSFGIATLHGTRV